jgi:hypothetical protein
MIRCLVLAVALMTGASGEGVPRENLEKGTPPAQGSAEAGAAMLLEALRTGDPAAAEGFFFPAAAFDMVKELPVPGRYHRKLVAWYAEDIAAEHPRFASGDWRLERLELGRCRWMEPGTEGNKVAYWSCRRSFVTARDGDRTRRFEIRVLINWGDRWYVTHLGPIRD